MKSWTECYTRAEGIVDLRQFNKGYNEYKSSFNGGIDRTMLPTEFLTDAEKVDNAFHGTWHFLRGDQSVKIDATTGSIGHWRGASFATYGGSWLVIDSFQIDKMKTGMMHWEYSFHYQNDIYNNVLSPRYIEMKMLIDDMSVAEISPLTRPVGTFRGIADFPLSGGKHNIKIMIRVPKGAATTESQFHITSQQHLFIGRWR